LNIDYQGAGRQIPQTLKAAAEKNTDHAGDIKKWQDVRIAQGIA
jgi:hypothetical protein